MNNSCSPAVQVQPITHRGFPTHTNGDQSTTDSLLKWQAHTHSHTHICMYILYMCIYSYTYTPTDSHSPSTWQTHSVQQECPAPVAMPPRPLVDVWFHELPMYRILGRCQLGHMDFDPMPSENNVINL